MLAQEVAQPVLEAAVHFVEGLILLKKGRPGKAAQRFERSLDLEANADVYLNLAKACCELVDGAHRAPPRGGTFYGRRRSSQPGIRHEDDLDPRQRPGRPGPRPQ